MRIWEEIVTLLAQLQDKLQAQCTVSTATCFNSTPKWSTSRKANTSYFYMVINWQKYDNLFIAYIAQRSIGWIARS
jgi:hypothetical protein